jgi:hypothetical protein
MLRETEELRALERRYTRDFIAPLGYRQALDRFSALWQHARMLNPGFPGDWEHDVAADVELARVLNGLGSPA